MFISLYIQSQQQLFIPLFYVVVLQQRQHYIFLFIQAAKPKGSKSEKENNPIRMLPDVRKLEHLWKEELAR